MDSTKEKKKKLRKNEVTDIGELGGEIIALKDDKILEGGGVKEGQGDTKTKKKNKRGNSEGKNMNREAELEGEGVASSRKLVEKGDATCSEDYAKVFKKKKNKDGKRERKDEIMGREAALEGEDVDSSRNVVEKGDATCSEDYVKVSKKKKNKEGKRERKDENMDREAALEGEDVDSSRKFVEKGDATCSEDYVKALKKKKNKEGKRERKDENMDREAALEGEDVDSSRKVVEKGDATCSKDYVKVLKKKKDKEGKRDRIDEAVEHLTVNNDINAKKAERKKKDKKGGSGPQLTEHSVEDAGQATDKIHNVEIVDRGQELDGGLVEKAERKKKKNDKKRTGIDYQIPEQRVEDVSLPSGHGSQNTKIVETVDVLDDCLVEKVGKKKRKDKKIEVEVNLGASEDVTELPSNVTQELQNKSTKGFETDCTSDKDVTKKSKKKQKTREKEKESNASGSQQVNADSAGNEKGNLRKRKKPDSVAEGDQDANPVKKKKTVKFSDQVEVFPVSDNEEKLVQGKRFSREEDEILKKAVHDYIEGHCLGDEGLNMVLNCRKHREVRNCWKEIALALPHRPKMSVYYRAQTLFRRSESTKWTKEDLEQVKEFQKKHGNQWKILAQDLQKHRVHVKDTWRRIRLSNAKKGHWNQEEYQNLFDLVNLDLKTRYKEEKKSKHGMLRDNICWTAISDKLATRTHALCCQKWYDQLTSSLVAEGEWSDVDDYRLINALYELDASCIEDVVWDNLLEHRDGDVCKKRWTQMVLHIGPHKTQSFGEQVEVLAKRYCPDLIDVREEWDNKPYADLATDTNPDPESD